MPRQLGQRTGMPLAMFHEARYCFPAISRSRNANSATVCSSCELHAEPRAVPVVDEGALVTVPQRLVLL